MASLSHLRKFSVKLQAKFELKNIIGISVPCGGNRNPNFFPHRTMPPARGQDLDTVNVIYSYLIHSDWDKLDELVSSLTSFRIKHVLLKSQKDHVLVFEFFKWIELKNSELNTLDVNCIVLHILTKYRKFKSAESILKKSLTHASSDLDFPRKLLDALIYSYKLCDSSSRIFDSLFKTYAHMKKFRNASNCFCFMKGYGFYPTVKSCNAYLSALSNSNRWDITSAFYHEMRRCRISPNLFTLNMVMEAYCKLGKLDSAVVLFNAMEGMGLSHDVVSYNTLVAGYVSKGLMITALKLKNTMSKKGMRPDVVTYNTLMNGLSKEGKLSEACKLLREMKREGVSPTVVTYNILISGFSEAGNDVRALELFEEMSMNGVKADVLTYNGVILGLCKEGKTKKAAYMVKQLDREKLLPNASTFAGLIIGQCVRNDLDRAFQIFESMTRSGFHPNETTLEIMLSGFLRNYDYDGGVKVLKEMMKRLIWPKSETLSQLFQGLQQCGEDELIRQLCIELKMKYQHKNGQGLGVTDCVTHLRNLRTS